MPLPRLFPFRPLEIKRTDSLQLNEEEQKLFSDWAQEHTQIAGTDIEFYHLDTINSVKDPLYDEAQERKFIGPYKIRAYVSYPEQQPEAQPQGTILKWDATAWVARRELEDKRAPAPQPGDVLRLWKIPFFTKEAAFDENIPGAGFYFNIINVNNDGHLFDTSTFVGFRMTLRRRTDIAPERRITNT